MDSNQITHITANLDDDVKVGHLVTAMCGFIGPWKGPDFQPEAICPACVLALLAEVGTLQAEVATYTELMFPDQEVK